MKKLTAILMLALASLAATAATAAAAPPAQDQNWLTASISGDRFEIAGGKIALARAEVPAVKALARRLISDHSKSLQEALDLAHEWGVKGPPAATPSEQWELHRMRFTPRSHFDAQYTALEVKDHNQDIEETGFEARRGSAWDIRQDALKELPMLNMHLQLSKSAAKSVDAANAG